MKVGFRIAGEGEYRISIEARINGRKFLSRAAMKRVRTYLQNDLFVALLTRGFSVEQIKLMHRCKKGEA